MKLETEKPAEVEQHRHLHRCQNCGTIWGHGHMMADDVEAHKCPKCGRNEWRQFSGGQATRRQATHAEAKPSGLAKFFVMLQIAMLAAAIVLAADLLIEWLTPAKA